MDLQLAGKRALLTGGSRGIGLRIARVLLAEEVADVVAFLASPRSVAITGDAIAAGGGAIDPIHY
jgi:NAD(P)-dependent dehydrogenase (short-subunit alcohol dehydrogenase family)